MKRNKKSKRCTEAVSFESLIAHITNESGNLPDDFVYVAARGTRKAEAIYKIPNLVRNACRRAGVASFAKQRVVTESLLAHIQTFLRRINL